MRLVAVSDIHGNLPALEAVLAHARRSGFDAIVNLGDTVSGPLWPRETIEYLALAGWTTLAGNHERQLLTQEPHHMSPSDAFAAAQLGPNHREWLRSLPGTAWVNDTVFACHGTPGSDLTFWLETVTGDHGVAGSPGVRRATEQEVQQRMGRYLGGRDAAQATLALCGHSHLPRAVQLDDGPLVVNAGSVGLQAYDDTHPHVHCIENGTPHARYVLAERGPQGWHVEFRAVAYDWLRAARRAWSNSRPDWAHALRTGRVGRAASAPPVLAAGRAA